MVRKVALDQGAQVSQNESEYHTLVALIRHVLPKLTQPELLHIRKQRSLQPGQELPPDFDPEVMQVVLGRAEQAGFQDFWH